MVENAPNFQEYKEILSHRIINLAPALRESLRNLRSLQFHPEIDLIQFEFIHDGAAEHFPFLMLTKRRKDGADWYSGSISYDPRRSGFHDQSTPELFSGLMYLLDEPLIDKPLLRYYYPDDLDTDLIEECDIHFFSEVSEWFLRLWKEEVGSNFPVSAYFICMGDDANNQAFDLCQAKKVSWDKMYELPHALIEP